MKPLTLIAAFAAAVSLSACASVETVTRSAPATPQAVQPVPAAFSIHSVQVSVPASLSVSEANLYLPASDIVWREDPIGDRRAQVKAIFEEGLQKAAARSTGGVPVVLDIEVTRFHALTEKARYTVGGVHSVRFILRLVDPETGRVLTEPHEIKADFKAYGGSRAIKAERQGITQKYRITERIAEVIGQELSGAAAQPTLAAAQGAAPAPL